MAKKTRLGSDPLGFIKNTENGVRESSDINDSGSMDTAPLKEKTFRMKTEKTGDNESRLLFEGDMTIYTIENVYAQLKNSINTCNAVMIDLSGINKIDTSGFQLLLMARKALNDRGKGVSLVEPSNEVRNIFQNYGEKTFG